MTSHPNRSRRKPAPARNPKPAEIRKLRESAGLTQTDAGALIHASMRAWQDYEGGQRRLHPGLHDLFRTRLLARDIDSATIDYIEAEIGHGADITLDAQEAAQVLAVLRAAR